MPDPAPNPCKHQNWYCVVGQPSVCIDCGKVGIHPKFNPPDEPPRLRIVK